MFHVVWEFVGHKVTEAVLDVEVSFVVFENLIYFTIIIIIYFHRFKASFIFFISFLEVKILNSRTVHVRASV